MVGRRLRRLAGPLFAVPLALAVLVAGVVARDRRESHDEGRGRGAGAPGAERESRHHTVNEPPRLRGNRRSPAQCQPNPALSRTAHALSRRPRLARQFLGHIPRQFGVFRYSKATPMGCCAPQAEPTERPAAQRSSPGNAVQSPVTFRWIWFASTLPISRMGRFAAAIARPSSARTSLSTRSQYRPAPSAMKSSCGSARVTISSIGAAEGG